jgi:rubredoxin-NAD+ reductase
MTAPLIILGTGLAGYGVAREWRRLDTTTPLVLVSQDAAGYYSKPMLSNALASKKTAATLVMKDAAKMAAELNAEVIAGHSATHIDTAARTVTLDDGRVLAYRDLVLAQGADPIRLPLGGDAADAVLSVNNIDDYARFADQLEGAQSVAILGGGLIGCEFANDLLHRGVSPTVLDLADRALARLLPAEASARLQAKLEAGGVRFEWGVSATRVDRSESGALQVTLSDGRTVVADRVLSAIGLRPRTALAQAAGIGINRGVVTSRTLATTADHVYALGDVAEVQGHWLPYVMPLMAQSRALAATLAGNTTEVAYPAMPVTVKTPANPTVVCPPPADVAGQWAVESDDAGLVGRYTDAAGALRGFVLMGAATSQRQVLATLVPALLS